MLTPSQKGSIAEAAIVAEAVKLGIGVCKPVNDGLRYDLIFDVGRLLRVQCKWAVRRGDVVVVNCRTCRRTNGGYLRTTYSAAEVDVIAAYCAALDRCYLLPLDLVSGRPSIMLRLAPTRNSQRLRVNWGAEYEFEATLAALQGP